MKYIILLLSITGCSTLTASPVAWFDQFDNVPETSATVYGDCTTDAQCEELVPEQNFFCYKSKSYVGTCVKIID